MIKKTTNQLSFESDGYIEPDNNNQPDGVGKPSKGKPVSQKSRKKKTLTTPTTLQPFLPGLSRRGRPRSKNPVSPSVRAAESRKKRLDSGVKRVELLLEPMAAEDLDYLVSYYRVSKVEIIARLLNKAARRIRKNSQGTDTRQP
jgi:hypothetical protein